MTTHTLAFLPVLRSTYEDVEERLKTAGYPYDTMVHCNQIDMNGIALQPIADAAEEGEMTLATALIVADGCHEPAARARARQKGGQPGTFLPREQACAILAREVRQLQKFIYELGGEHSKLYATKHAEIEMLKAKLAPKEGA